MANNGVVLALLGLAVIGGIGYVATRPKTSATPKYKIGDILYNPPDTADNFTIQGFSVVGGINYYVLRQNQDGTIFDAAVSLVDNSTAWAKL